MVITQTLGNNASQISEPNGRNAIRGVINDNLDIKNAINASRGRTKYQTKKQRDVARQKAILKAMKRNPAFETAIDAALNRLLTNR